MNREKILEAVKKDGYSLEYVSEEFRNDKEVVLEAVKQNGRSLKFASKELRNDKEVVNNNGELL
jgi:lambda repressor-like predicted transcriptional regulator